MKLPSKPRVLFISEPHGGPYEYIFENFHLGFLRLGCELARLNPLETSLEVYKHTVQTFRPDIVFGMLRNTQSVRACADLLAQYHPTVTLNWFQEDPNNVTAEMLECSRRFDYWFTQDPRTVPFWKTKAFFSPHAFDETVYDDLRLDRIYDVSFIGNLGHQRVKMMLWPYLDRLSRRGNKALICTERPMGPPLMHPQIERLLRWERIRSVLMALPFWRCAWEIPGTERERSLAVNRSKIHFGLSRSRTPWEEDLKKLLPGYPLDKHGFFCQCKGRLFHAVGCRTLALNEHYPELEDMFVVGKEVITFEFGQLDDMEDKLNYYLKHDSERQKIASAGYERGRKQHTFVARIQQIFDTLRQGSQA